MSLFERTVRGYTTSTTTKELRCKVGLDFESLTRRGLLEERLHPGGIGLLEERLHPGGMGRVGGQWAERAEGATSERRW